MYDSKFSFERQISCISSFVAQKIGLLRKSFTIFGDRNVSPRCFNSFILPCLEYCTPVWFSAVDSHWEELLFSTSFPVLTQNSVFANLCAPTESKVRVGSKIDVCYINKQICTLVNTNVRIKLRMLQFHTTNIPQCIKEVGNYKK